MLTRARRLSVLSIVSSLFVATVGRGQEPARATVGDVEINLPVPPGFTESQAARTAFGQVITDQHRLLAAYASPEDTVKLDQGQPVMIERYIMVLTPVGTEALDVTPEVFERFVKHMSLEAVFPKADLAEFLTRSSVPRRNAVSVELTASLGIFLRRPEAMGWAVVVPVMHTQDDQITAVYVVRGVSAVRIRNRLLTAHVCARLRAAGDVDWVQATATDWVNAVIAANSTTSAKRIK